MAEKRIVVEHKDGRRIACYESDLEIAERNPFNHGARIHEFDANSGATVISERGPKPMDDWQSLAKEGFKPVMAIDPETGHEVPL